mmetsp:Transcript_26983/g.48780  ORF Transcript_26983/g.48780 Transcript_26983/m.48780 type:complete len:284 (+) Transcript_26983:46-897(+)
MTWDLVGHPQDFMGPVLQVGDVSAVLSAGLVSTALRHAPLVILLVLQLYTAGAESTDEEPCSKALGFNETSGPKDRSKQDLLFCSEHHKRTCCERNHSRQVLGSWAPFSHDKSTRCATMSRLALCSFCDADVGSGIKAAANIIVLCPSFCKRWFEACAEDFFAPGSSSGSMQPCGPGSLVCSPLTEITEDPAAFCAGVAGFSVAETEEDADGLCYDGVPAASSKGKGPRAFWERPKPAGKPWWRQTLETIQYSKFGMWLEANSPSLIIALVAVVFSWFLLKGD